MNSTSSSTQQNTSLLNGAFQAKPEWCPETRVLSINGKVVKHFKWPAPNQEKLITALAEENWPNRIDDPLPPNDVCPKRRLHDTIKCLNRNRINKLIKFRGDGTGQGVLWEFTPEQAPIIEDSTEP